MQIKNARDMSSVLEKDLNQENKDFEKTYTRAPENIPAPPTPAIARPIIKATDVGAAPQMTRFMFSACLCPGGSDMFTRTNLKSEYGC